jgi:hypothetical protein
MIVHMNGHVICSGYPGLPGRLYHPAAARLFPYC